MSTLPASSGPDPAQFENSGRRLEPFILVLALALAVLRFALLDRWSFWYDEVMTVTDAQYGVARGELHNPLGYRLLLAFAEWFGLREEWAWRFLPALAGFLLVPLSYWAFGMFGGRGPAGAAALLVASSSWALYWSQNARFYTLAACVSLAGAGFLLRGLMRGRLTLGVLGLILCALAASFHTSAALLLAGVGMGLCAASVFPRFWSSAQVRTARLLLALCALAGLFGLPFLLGAWRTYLASKQVAPGLGTMVASLMHFGASLGFFLSPAFAALLVLAVLQAWRKRDFAASFAAMVVIAGLGAAAFAALFGRVTAQYAFCLLPWMAYLCAWLMHQTQARWARALGLVLLVIPGLADQALYSGLRHGDRPRWREALAYVWQERQADDLVAAMAAPLAQYYLDRREGELRRPTVAAWLDKWRPDLPQEWLHRGRPVWIVICPENLEDFAGEDRRGLEQFLREECRIMRRFPVPAIGRDPSVEVYYYPG